MAVRSIGGRDARHRVQTLELPGFGDNPAPPCQDLHGYAETVNGTWQRLDS